MLKAVYDGRNLYITDYKDSDDLVYPRDVISDTEPCETINGVFFDKNSDGKIIGIEIIGVKLEEVK